MTDIQNKQPPEVKTIVDAIKLLSKPEVLEDYQTQKGKVTATKETHLEKLPPVLVLHLKRFLFNDGSIGKIDKDVSFPLDLQPPQRKRNFSFILYPWAFVIFATVHGAVLMWWVSIK